jgi:cysteine desulfurase
VSLVHNLLYNTAMMKRPIYLDYAATTPVDPRVVTAMTQSLQDCFGNPASTHAYGWAAEAAVAQARQSLADLLRCQPEEIIWTSGATEANNLALKGAFFGQNSKKHLITLSTEHPSVLASCRFLQEEAGARLTVLQPLSTGLLDLAALDAAIDEDTLLISVMHLNNEIGVMQDLQAIGDLAHRRGVLFHVDAAQSVGKYPLDLSQLPIDLLSISSHKMYGPKGVGALFIRAALQPRIQAQMQGGGQERGLRSGTLATHQIVGLGEAARLAQVPEEGRQLTALRDRLWAGLAGLPGVHRHGALSAGHILNLSFEGLPADLLLSSLPDLALSKGSACHSRSLTPSPVLESLGVPLPLAQGALRLSLGRFTTEAEIDQAIAYLTDKVNFLRSSSLSLWKKED